MRNCGQQESRRKDDVNSQAMYMPVWEKETLVMAASEEKSQRRAHTRNNDDSRPPRSDHVFNRVRLM